MNFCGVPFIIYFGLQTPHDVGGLLMRHMDIFLLRCMRLLVRDVGLHLRNALIVDIERNRFQSVSKYIVSETHDLPGTLHNREIPVLAVTDTLPVPRYNHNGLLRLLLVPIFSNDLV